MNHTYEELEDQIRDTVNNNPQYGGYYDIEEILDTILRAEDLPKAFDLIGTIWFWKIVEANKIIIRERKIVKLTDITNNNVREIITLAAISQQKIDDEDETSEALDELKGEYIAYVKVISILTDIKSYLNIHALIKEMRQEMDEEQEEECECCGIHKY